MLVLSRDMNEAIMIGELIKVIVLKIDQQTVRLGFQAPLSIPIYREEVFKKIHPYYQSKNWYQFKL
jgi:carbon storage regulator